MKSRTNQQGSTLVIIVIVIIVLVVLGALASIFWQNFTKQMGDAALESEKKTAQQTESTRAADALKPENVVLNTFTSATLNGYGLTIKHPSTWKVDESDSKDRTVTSPDGEVVIHYAVVAPGATGATCGDEVTIKSAEWSKLAGVAKGEFNSIVYLSPAGFYGYKFGMNQESDAGHKKAGDTFCDAAPQQITLSASPYTFATLTANFTSVDEGDGKSLEAIKKALASDNAIIAQRIIESAVIKD